jgi:hypothetical protein
VRPSEPAAGGLRCQPGAAAGNRCHKRAVLAGSGLKPGAVAAILTGTPDPPRVAAQGGGGAVVPSLAEPAGGSLECYYWMSGQDEMGIFGHPGSHTRAAVSLAATSSGAFTRFETHELIEASDLTAIAERAQGTANQPPGT